MMSSHYPTLHLKDLDGKSADPFGLRLAKTPNAKTSFAVIPHEKLGHVAVVVEDPPGHFTTKFLSREEADAFAASLHQQSGHGSQMAG